MASRATVLVDGMNAPVRAPTAPAAVKDHDDGPLAPVQVLAEADHCPILDTASTGT